MRNNRLSFVLPILLLSYAGPTYAQHQAIAHHEIQRLAAREDSRVSRPTLPVRRCVGGFVRLADIARKHQL